MSQNMPIQAPLSRTKKPGQFRRELPLHLILVPGVIFLIIFSYIPIGGLAIGFQRYIPAKGISGSAWVRLGNFRYLMSLPDVYQVMFNTVFIASMKIVAGIVVPVVFSLLLNEIRCKPFNRIAQTVIYMPYFLSWIVLSGAIIDILSPSDGIVGQFLASLGIEPIFFLADENWFPYIMVITDVWKNFGFATIVYLAALTSIDPTYYEAAIIDGANRWKQTIYVTLPGIAPIVMLMTTLALGNVLNAGFDQIFNLYSPAVYRTGDIIDTMIYRMGIVDANFGVATAMGIFSSFVSLIFVSISYLLAYRLSGYRVF